MRTFDFEHKLEFSSPVGVVYAFFLIRDGKEIPFYVGETGVFTARMGNYYAANFGAATDFKVGEAVKYLWEKGHRITVAYKEHDNRKVEERRLCKRAKSRGFKLLNDLKGYKYRHSTRERERQRVQQWCDKYLFAERRNSNETLRLTP